MAKSRKKTDRQLADEAIDRIARALNVRRSDIERDLLWQARSRIAALLKRIKNQRRVK